MNTILDILTGHYSSHEPININPNEEDVFSSIRAHLMRLLNTRQGSIKHLPNYGLPDIGEIFQSLPGGINQLTHAIENCIQHYEPRLNHARVTYKTIKERDCVLCLEISGEIRSNQTIKYATFFISGGKAIVE